MANPTDGQESPTPQSKVQDEKLKPHRSDSAESLNPHAPDDNANVLTRKAALMQITMAIVANITIISSGMGLGFPSIAMLELTNSTSSVTLSENEASWFGEFACRDVILSFENSTILECD